MDTKQKQRAVIEFLLRDGWTGDEIAIPRHTVSEKDADFDDGVPLDQQDSQREPGASI
jgi:hypothetical protein